MNQTKHRRMNKNRADYYLMKFNQCNNNAMGLGDIILPIYPDAEEKKIVLEFLQAMCELYAVRKLTAPLSVADSGAGIS